MKSISRKMNRRETRYTSDVVGSSGFMGMVGYDWAPRGVELATHEASNLERQVMDPEGYAWQNGAAMAGECLATGRDMLVTPEHALHVIEIMTAVREFQATGRRFALQSTFKWPVVI